MRRKMAGKSNDNGKGIYFISSILAIVCVVLLLPLLLLLLPSLPLLCVCLCDSFSFCQIYRRKKLKFCSCFASINAWLANFGTENRLQSPPQQMLFSGCIFFGQFSLTTATSRNASSFFSCSIQSAAKNYSRLRFFLYVFYGVFWKSVEDIWSERKASSLSQNEKIIPK